MKIWLLNEAAEIVAVIDTENPEAELAFYGPQLGAVAWSEWTEPAPTLDELRAAKWAEIKRARDAADRQPLEYAGHLLDFDDAGREKLLWACRAADVAGELFSVDWTCADNSVLELTAATIRGIPIAAAARSNANHQLARTLREQIDAAESAEELNAITWEVA